MTNPRRRRRLRARGTWARVCTTLLACGCMAVIGTSELAAQATGSISGQVTETGGSPGIAGVAVTLVELGRTVVAGPQGRFQFSDVPVGLYRIRATHLGHATAEARVRVAAGSSATTRLEMAIQPINLSGVRVTVVRPDLIPESSLDS